MNCPVCNIELKMADRQGIEIDYCEKCRGVWLDRGELDKIIERSMNGDDDHHEEREPREHSDDHRAYAPFKRHRRSRLGELFDIFD